MQIIQTWRNNNYPEQLIECLTSVVSLIGKDNYLLICNNTEIADRVGVKSINFDDDYNRILKEIKYAAWWGKYCTMNMYMADMIRLYYANVTPDLFYLDADFYLTALPEFPKSRKPYILRRDICMFYVNNEQQFFKNLFASIPTAISPTDYSIYKYIKFYQGLKNSFWNIENNGFIRYDFGSEWRT